MGILGYTDDNVLLSPTLDGLQNMLNPSRGSRVLLCHEDREGGGGSASSINH